MASIILPRRFTQQPQYPAEINAGSPFSANLRLAVSGAFPTVNLARSLPGAARTAIYGTLGRGACGPANRGFNCQNSESNYIEYHAASDYPYASGAWSTNTTHLFVVSRSSDSTASPGEISVLLAGNYNFFLTNTYDSAGSKYKVHVESGTTYSSLFVDGAKQSSATKSNNELVLGKQYVVAASGAHAYDYAYARIGSGGFAGFADIALALFWDRQLSDAELAELTARPWQLFRRSPQVLYFDTAAGGPTYTLTAATGSFTVTGNAATLKAARSLTASTGTFTVTGQAAGLRAARKITASTGTFTFTGQAAGLTTARKLTTSTGSFAFTGQTAGLTAARKLTTATGTFVLTGNSATLTYSPVGSYSLTANTGSFALTGQAAGLTASRKIAAALGQFNLTGNAASLLRGFALTGGTGAFVLTGNAATLTYTSQATLTAETGVFTFTGNAATLTYSGLTYAALSAPRSINRNIQAGGRNNTQTNRR